MKKCKILFILSTLLLLSQCSTDKTTYAAKDMTHTLTDEFGTIEASGIVNIDKQFVIISDETEDNSPYIFVADSNGNVVSSHTIDGLYEMSDMEGITKDDEGNIYITSSLSVSKQNYIKYHRKLLVKVDGDSFSLISKIDLYDVLQSSDDPFIVEALNDSTLDIEGLAYKDNNLYFGVKAPLVDGKANIIKISNIFDVSREISIYKSLDLGGGILSLEFISDTLYISSKGSSESKIWTYDTLNDSLEYLYNINTNRIEGLALDGAKIILTKDGNDESSTIIFME